MTYVPVAQRQKPTAYMPVQQREKPQVPTLAEKLPYTMGGALRPEMPPQPKSILLEVGKNLPSIAGEAWSSWTASEKKRRAEQTFGQQAYTELVKRPAKIIATGGGMMLGGISEIGKSFMELGGTYARAALTDETIGEASLKMQKALRGDKKQREFEKQVFGFEAGSYGDWQPGIEKFLNDNNALPIEKKTLPALVPLMALMADLTPGGQPAKIGVRKAIERIAKETSEIAIRRAARDLAIPESILVKVLPDLMEANNANRVKAILRPYVSQETNMLTRQLAEEIGTASARAVDEVPTPTRTMDGIVPTPASAVDDVVPPARSVTPDDVVPPARAITPDDVVPPVRATPTPEAQALTRATDELTSAAQEMKRAGKTFEEFVEGQGVPKVEMVKVVDLPDRAKAVGMPSSKFEELSTSMKEKGIVNPIIISDSGMVLDGMRRATIADELGIPEVPAIRVSGMTVEEARVLSNSYSKKLTELTDIWNRADTTATPAPRQAPQQGTPPVSTQASKAGQPLVDFAQTTTRERGLITSVKRGFKEIGSRVQGQYIPRSTDKLSRDARELIETNLPEAQKIARERTDDKGIAVAMELLKYYDEKGLYDEAAELAMHIAPKLTELGRSIQAAALLANLSPEGQLKLAGKAVVEWNKANPWKKARKLGAEESEHILKEMKEIEGMEEGIEKAMRFYHLQKYITGLVPSSLFSKIANVWKAGLLTGLKTTGLNIFSNIAHAAFEIMKDVPASGVDSVVSLFTGKRTKTFTLTGYGGGVKDGFEKGWRYLKTGFDERNIGEKLDYKRISFGKGKVAKMFEFYTDSVFRVMGAADQPTYYGAVARSIADQAIARGKTKGLKKDQLKAFVDRLIQNPDEEMMLTAILDGKTAVFQQDTKLGEIAGAIVNVAPVAEYIIPFRRTPSAVAMQIYNYTPAGPITEVVKQIRKKEFNQRSFSEAVGRGATGLGVLYLGYLAYQNGMVSLDYPDNERERERWKNEGRKPNTVLIDGKWRNPIVLGPAGNLLLIGAHYDRAFQKEGSVTGAAIYGSFGALKSFTEQTFLTGISSLMEAVNNPERNGTSFIAGLVSSSIPTIISDIARATDPIQRRTASPDGAFETILNRIQARIPVLREELEPVINSLGEEQKRDGNFLETMLDPTRPSNVISTPVIDELKRLTEEGYAVSPTLQGNKVGYNSLSGEENTIMWIETGSLVRQKLDSLLKNEAYQKMSDEKKAKQINDFVSKAKDDGRARTILRLTNGMTQEEYRQALAKYKEDKLLTEAVYRRLLVLQSQ